MVVLFAEFGQLSVTSHLVVPSRSWGNDVCRMFAEKKYVCVFRTTVKNNTPYWVKHVWFLLRDYKNNGPLFNPYIMLNNIFWREKVSADCNSWNACKAVAPLGIPAFDSEFIEWAYRLPYNATKVKPRSWAPFQITLAAYKLGTLAPLDSWSFNGYNQVPFWNHYKEDGPWNPMLAPRITNPH